MRKEDESNDLPQCDLFGIEEGRDSGVFLFFFSLFSVSVVKDLFKVMDLYLHWGRMLYVGGKDADQQSTVFLQVKIGSIY